MSLAAACARSARRPAARIGIVALGSTSLIVASALTGVAPEASAWPAPFPVAVTVPAPAASTVVTTVAAAVTPTAAVVPVAAPAVARTVVAAAPKRAVAVSRVAAVPRRVVVRPALAAQAALRLRVVSQALALRGAPYRYGGTTPRGFDCSGYVRYVFARVGRSLPRTAQAQRWATRPVSRAAARPGDLVFFSRGGYVYHVAIYLGSNRVVQASRPGYPVGIQRIWTSAISFGRVI